MLHLSYLCCALQAGSTRARKVASSSLLLARDSTQTTHSDQCLSSIAGCSVQCLPGYWWWTTCASSLRTLTGPSRMVTLWTYSLAAVVGVVEQIRSEHRRAGQCRQAQSNAGQSRTEQNRAEQSRTKQSRGLTVHGLKEAVPRPLNCCKQQSGLEHGKDEIRRRKGRAGDVSPERKPGCKV